MVEGEDFAVAGHGGKLHGRVWRSGEPTYVALLCHGYGEHIGRYEWVADRLVADGAVVYGLDHIGHGTSDGERVLINDFEMVVDDFHALQARAQAEHPDLPVVLIGHSMGGLIAARYGQRYAAELAVVVLSGPVLGTWAAVDHLLSVEEIPDTPIDPATLSRDAAVGEAYVADPLVWHGPFKRPTLRALREALITIGSGPRLSMPAIWMHGSDDQLVPLTGTEPGWRYLAGPHAKERIYSGARHEIFNETNKADVLDDVVWFIHANLPD